MKTFRLSKSRILAGLQCPKRLYLQTHHPKLAEESAGMQARFAQGHRLGEVARDLHESGVLIGHDDALGRALAETRDVLADRSVHTVFEATFEHGGVLVRADVLERKGGAYRMVEVKSSTSVKPYHLQDCAVQSWVVEGAGYPLKGVELAHVDSSFVYDGDGQYEGLLGYEDVTEAIRPLKEQVPGWIRSFQDMLAGPMPSIEAGEQCTDPYECPFLGHCAPPRTEYPVTLLPYGGRVVRDLLEEGVEDVRDIPEGRLAKDVHERIRRATIAGRHELDAAARDVVAALPYPRYYLDYETIQFVVPEWVGTRPYAQLPFQWSCHIEQADGSLMHREFLDTSGQSPMRAFAESLVAALGDTGPVLVYNVGFERSRTQELAERFPDLAEALNAISARMFDLLPVARQHYYHPAMKGSWSIKAVLPTIAPDLDYGQLDEVQDGGMAQSAYQEMIRPDTPEERRARLAASLREYCKLDTLAMVRVARFFEGRCEAEPCPA
jgi:hypothetical protein